MADTTATLGIGFESTGAETVKKDLRDVAQESKNAAQQTKEAAEEIKRAVAPNEQWSAATRRRIESEVAAVSAMKMSKEAAAGYRAELALGANASQGAIAAARALAAEKLALSRAAQVAGSSVRGFGTSLISSQQGLQAMRGGIIGLSAALGGFGNAAGAVRSGLAGLAVALGVGLVSALENAGDKIEITRNRLEALLGKGLGGASFDALQKSADAAGKSIGGMAPMAETLARLLDDVQSKSSIQFKFINSEEGIQAARNIGMALKDDVAGTIENIRKLMAADGLGFKEADSQLAQFRQSLGKTGEATGDVFRKIAEQAPTFARALMEAIRPLQTGIGTQRLNELFKIFDGQPAKIDEVGRAILKLQGAADKIKPDTSIKRAWEDLWDAITKGEEDFQRKAGFDPITSSLNTMASAVRSLSQTIRESEGVADFMDKIQAKIAAAFDLSGIIKNFSFQGLIDAAEADMDKFADSLDANAKVIMDWANKVASYFQGLLAPIGAYIAKLAEAAAAKLPGIPQEPRPSGPAAPGLSDMGGAGPQTDQLEGQLKELGQAMATTAGASDQIEGEVKNLGSAMVGAAPAIVQVATDSPMMTAALAAMGPAMSGVVSPAEQAAASFSNLGPAASAAAPPVGEVNTQLQALGPAAMSAAAMMQQAAQMINQAAQSAAASAAAAAAASSGGGGGDISFDIGPNKAGGMYKVPGSDARTLKGTVHGGEVVAVIPSGGADDGLLTRLHTATHKPMMDTDTGDVVDIGQNAGGGTYNIPGDFLGTQKLGLALQAAIERLRAGLSPLGPGVSGSYGFVPIEGVDYPMGGKFMGYGEGVNFPMRGGRNTKDINVGSVYKGGGGSTGGRAGSGTGSGASGGGGFRQSAGETTSGLGSRQTFVPEALKEEMTAAALAKLVADDSLQGDSPGSIGLADQSYSRSGASGGDDNYYATDSMGSSRPSGGADYFVGSDMGTGWSPIMPGGMWENLVPKSRWTDEAGRPLPKTGDQNYYGRNDTISADRNYMGGNDTISRDRNLIAPTPDMYLDRARSGGYFGGDSYDSIGLQGAQYGTGAYYDPGSMYDDSFGLQGSQYDTGGFTGGYDPGSMYDSSFGLQGGQYDTGGAYNYYNSNQGYDEGGFYNPIYDQAVSQGGPSYYDDPYYQGGGSQGYDTGGSDYYAGDYAEGGSFTVPNRGGGRDAIRTIMNLTAGEKVSVDSGKGKKSKWIGGDYDGMSGGENHFHFYGMTAQSVQAGPSRLAARRFVQRALQG